MATGTAKEASGIFSQYTGKYAPLSDGYRTVQPSKRARHSTGSTGGVMSSQPSSQPSNYLDLNMDMLKQLPSDEKLNVLLEGMLRLNLMQCRVDNIESYVYFNSAAHEVVDQRLKLVEYKQIDLEARQKEVNLLFSNCDELLGENPVELVSSIIVDRLKIEKSSFHITRAYRIGRVFKPRPGTAPYRRPPTRQILATFNSVDQVHLILKNATLLKGTQIGISRDYPKEISEARKSLWAEFKALRELHGASNVRIAYPAALIVKGQTQKDLFPDWHSLLAQSRNTNVKQRIVDCIKIKQDEIKRQMANTGFEPGDVTSMMTSNNINNDQQSSHDNVSESESCSDTNSLSLSKHSTYGRKQTKISYRQRRGRQTSRHRRTQRLSISSSRSRSTTRGHGSKYPSIDTSQKTRTNSQNVNDSPPVESRQRNVKT